MKGRASPLRHPTPAPPHPTPAPRHPTHANTERDNNGWLFSLLSENKCPCRSRLTVFVSAVNLWSIWPAVICQGLGKHFLCSLLICMVV